MKAPNKEIIETLNSLKDEELIKFISIYSLCFKYLKENKQIEVINKIQKYEIGRIIQNVNLSEDAQEAAIKRFPVVIHYIKNASEDMKKKAIKLNPKAVINVIQKPSKELLDFYNNLTKLKTY